MKEWKRAIPPGAHTDTNVDEIPTGALVFIRPFSLRKRKAMQPDLSRATKAEEMYVPPGLYKVVQPTEDGPRGLESLPSGHPFTKGQERLIGWWVPDPRHNDPDWYRHLWDDDDDDDGPGDEPVAPAPTKQEATS